MVNPKILARMAADGLLELSNDVSVGSPVVEEPPLSPSLFLCWTDFGGGWGGWGVVSYGWRRCVKKTLDSPHWWGGGWVWERIIAGRSLLEPRVIRYCFWLRCLLSAVTCWLVNRILLFHFNSIFVHTYPPSHHHWTVTSPVLVCAVFSHPPKKKKRKKKQLSAEGRCPGAVVFLGGCACRKTC